MTNSQTGSKVIPCSDCRSERERIEKGGLRKVTSCEPLPGEDSKPAAERQCRMRWRKAEG